MKQPIAEKSSRQYKHAGLDFAKTVFRTQGVVEHDRIALRERLRREKLLCFFRPAVGLQALARELFADLQWRLRAMDAQVADYDHQVARSTREMEPARWLMQVEVPARDRHGWISSSAGMASCASC